MGFLTKLFPCKKKETATVVPSTSTPPQPATHSTSTPTQPAAPTQTAAHEEEERQIALAIQLSLAQNVQEVENAYDEEEDRQLAVALALSLSLEENLQSDEAAETNDSSLAHAHPLTELQQRPQECEYCCSSPVEVVFDPCGHVSCKDCSIKILDYDSSCPMCRRVINNVITFYL